MCCVRMESLRLPVTMTAAYQCVFRVCVVNFSCGIRVSLSYVTLQCTVSNPVHTDTPPSSIHTCGYSLMQPREFKIRHHLTLIKIGFMFKTSSISCSLSLLLSPCCCFTVNVSIDKYIYYLLRLSASLASFPLLCFKL